MGVKKRIYTKILTIGLAAVLLSGLIWTAVMYSSIKRTKIDGLNAIADIQKGKVTDYINNSYAKVNVILNRQDLKTMIAEYNNGPSEGLKQNIRALIKDSSGANVDFSNIFLLGADGKLLTSASDDPKAGDEQVISLSAGKDSGTYYKNIDGKPFVYFSAPIRSSDNQKIGTLVLKTSPDSVIVITQNYSGLGKTGETQIAAKTDDGQINLLNPQRFPRYNGSYPDSSKRAMTLALGGKEGNYTGLVDYRNIKVVSVTRFIPGAEWGIVVKQDSSEVFRPVYFAVKTVIFLTAIIGLLIYISLRWVLAAVHGPVNEARTGMKAIGSGNLDFRLKPKPKSEFGNLIKAFNDMANSLQAARKSAELEAVKRSEVIVKRNAELENQQAATLKTLETVKTERDEAVSSVNNLEKFKLAVDDVSDMVFAIDQIGTVIYVNKAVEKVTGYPEAENVGKKAVTGVIGGMITDDVLKDIWKSVKTYRRPYTGIVQGIRKNGVAYRAEMMVAPVLDGSGSIKHLLGIAKDVTEIKMIEKAKTDFVTLASRQLRTPLTAASWYTEMLLVGDAGKLTVNQKNYLRKIYDSNTNVVSLINSYLNVSRLELGVFSVRPKLTAIDETIDNIVKDVKPMFDAKNQKFIFNCPVKLPMVNLDPELFSEIIRNLLDNASKYTLDGGMISLTLRYNPRSEAEAYIVEVSDNGIGIPLRQQKELFSKMFRADNARKIEPEGNGLGLYVVKTIVTESGGKISFASQEDVGTTFIVSFPKTGMKPKKS